jgi:hypothetical protein
MHNYCTPLIVKEKFENFLIHRCNYILLSQVHCIWQADKTSTIMFNNPVYQSFACRIIMQHSQWKFTSTDTHTFLDAWWWLWNYFRPDCSISAIVFLQLYQGLEYLCSFWD